MNRSWLGAVVLLVACDRGVPAVTADAFESHAEDATTAAVDAAPEAPPPLTTACVDHFTLQGNPQSPTMNVQPQLDTTGTAYCVTLDATADFQAPDFYVATLQVQGVRSPYEVVMFDAQGALLQPGWDVTYGSSPPHTFAHLESSVTAGSTLESIVRIRMREGVGTTQVSFTLFEPFD